MWPYCHGHTKTLHIIIISSNIESLFKFLRSPPKAPYSCPVYCFRSRIWCRSFSYTAHFQSLSLDRDVGRAQPSVHHEDQGTHVVCIVTSQLCDLGTWHCIPGHLQNEGVTTSHLTGLCEHAVNDTQWGGLCGKSLCSQQCFVSEGRWTRPLHKSLALSGPNFLAPSLPSSLYPPYTLPSFNFTDWRFPPIIPFPPINLEAIAHAISSLIISLENLTHMLRL